MVAFQNWMNRCRVWVPSHDTAVSGDARADGAGHRVTVHGDASVLRWHRHAGISGVQTWPSVDVDTTCKRATKAGDLECRIHAFHKESHFPEKLHVAWMLLSKAACAALAYDARLMSKAMLDDESLYLEDRIRRAEATTFGVTEDLQARQRMRFLLGP